MQFVDSLARTARSRWIVSQEGSRQTYAVPLSFHRLNMLRTFYVDTWCRWGRSVLKLGPRSCQALATHFSAGLPPERIISFNCSVLRSRAMFYLKKPKLSSQQLSQEYCQFGEKFAGLVRDHLERQDLDSSSDCFFGFNTNCLETLEHLRRRRIFTVVDQVDPGKVEEDLCIEETEKWPGWARVPGRMSRDYWDRIEAEWKLADVVLVNSEWSATALVQQGVPPEKIIVVPLALEVPGGQVPSERSRSDSLKVLWLGSLILRKGIQYLVQAARLLEGKGIEFILAGPLGISEQAARSFPANMSLVGPITRDRIGEFYRQAHAFVLPTLSDGFAITQLEAMAYGLPVVATPNCGNVVTDGYDGFLVPARQAEPVAEALARLHDDPELLRAMSANALRTVARFDLPSNAALIERLALEKRTQGKMSSVL